MVKRRCIITERPEFRPCIEKRQLFNPRMSMIKFLLEKQIDDICTVDAR